MGIHSVSTEALALESRQRATQADAAHPSKRPCLSSSIESATNNKHRHMTPIIMGGANSSLVATTPQTATMFPIPQRYSFVGMPPLLTQPSLLTSATPFVPQPLVVEEEEDGQEEDEL